MAQYSMQDLKYKIEWEGNVLDVIEYGVTAEQVPEEIRILWASAVIAYKEFDKLAIEISDILEEVKC